MPRYEFTPTFGSSSADDIRAGSWMVAVHNDYMLDGIPHTFWLVTHYITGRFLKGEGLTDSEALDKIRADICTDGFPERD